MAHFTRQVNWDDEGWREERTKAKGDSEGEIMKHKGVSFFSAKKQHSYEDLKKAYPGVVNDVNLRVVIGKLKKSTMRKVPKTYLSVALTQKRLEDEYKSFEEPLQTWIQKTRKVIRKENSNMGEEVMKVDDAVHVAGGGLRAAGTMHTVHILDLFKRDFMEGLSVEELNFTAVHMQLPSELGNDEISTKEILLVWLGDLMAALLDKPSSEQLTMKVPICVSMCMMYANNIKQIVAGVVHEEAGGRGGGGHEVAICCGGGTLLVDGGTEYYGGESREDPAGQGRRDESVCGVQNGGKEGRNVHG